MICQNCGCFFCIDDAEEIGLFPDLPDEIYPRKIYCSHTCRTKANAKRSRPRRRKEQAEAERQAANCVRQKKRKYRSKAAANKERIRLNSTYRWMEPLTKAYQCGDHWHLTKRRDELDDDEENGLEITLANS